MKKTPDLNETMEYDKVLTDYLFNTFNKLQTSNR